MTPLTIFGLQPISYVSEIGISTKPDHQGPHLGPKTDMHVPQKTVFPSISCFVANISYSTLKLTPLIIFLLPPISWHIYHPKLSGALSEPSNSYAYTPKTPFSLASFFVANIRNSIPKMTTFAIFGYHPTQTHLIPIWNWHIYQP